MKNLKTESTRIRRFASLALICLSLGAFGMGMCGCDLGTYERRANAPIPDLTGDTDSDDGSESGDGSDSSDPSQ